MELWYFAHPKFGGRTSSLKAAQEALHAEITPLHEPIPIRSRDLRPTLFSGG